MAKFESSMEILMDLEFSSSRNALHYNPTEGGYTFMGIYQVAHPSWKGWKIVEKTLKGCDNSIKEASEILYNNDKLVTMVGDFYRREFYAKAKLSHLKSQNTANEIFVFSTNAGIRAAVKAAQEIVGTTVDGIIGAITIKALNEFDEEVFSREYDLLEQRHYARLIARNPAFKVYGRGWKNRSLAV